MWTRGLARWSAVLILWLRRTTCFHWWCSLQKRITKVKSSHPPGNMNDHRCFLIEMSRPIKSHPSPGAPLTTPDTSTSSMSNLDTEPQELLQHHMILQGYSPGRRPIPMSPFMVELMRFHLWSSISNLIKQADSEKTNIQKRSTFFTWITWDSIFIYFFCIIHGCQAPNRSAKRQSAGRTNSQSAAKSRG